VEFRATGSVLKFDGFLSVYKESVVEGSTPEQTAKKEEEILPQLSEGEVLEVKELLPSQRFTQPPRS